MHAVQFSLIRGGKKNARRAISGFTARFLRLNLLACHGRSREKDNALSPLSAPSVHTPRAYCRAASPVLPAVPGCCRTRLHGNAVDGNSRAICEPGFYPVGVHIVAAGKQFCHSHILQDLIFGVRSLEPMPSSRCRINRFFICLGVSARFLHGFCTVSKRAKGANRCKIGQRVQKLQAQNLRCIAER